MDDGVSNDKNGLGRQRKSLLITTIFLFVIKFADISVKEINVLGNSLDVSKSERFIWLIGVLWGYFLYRYFLYYVSYGRMNYQIKKVEVFKKIIDHRLKNIVESKKDLPDFVVVFGSVENQYYPLWNLFSDLKVRIQLRVYSNAFYEDDRSNREKTVIISWRAVFWFRIQGYFKSLFFTAEGTDYIFPFILSGLLLGYYVFY